MTCAPSKDSDQPGHLLTDQSSMSAWRNIGPLTTYWVHVVLLLLLCGGSNTVTLDNCSGSVSNASVTWSSRAVYRPYMSQNPENLWVIAWHLDLLCMDTIELVAESWACTTFWHWLPTILGQYRFLQFHGQSTHRTHRMPYACDHAHYRRVISYRLPTGLWPVWLPKTYGPMTTRRSRDLCIRLMMLNSYPCGGIFYLHHTIIYDFYHISHVMRKPVFRACDQVRLKPTAQLQRLARVLKFRL